MPLDRQVINIPFDGTLNEKVRAELIEPGSFLTLSNVLGIKKRNYQKRAGTAVFSSLRVDGTSRATGFAIGSLKGTPWTVDGQLLDAYSSTSSAWKSNALSVTNPSGSSAVPEAVVSREAVLPAANNNQCDVAVANGYAVFVTELATSTHTYATVVIDLSTGARVHYSETAAASGQGVCLVSVSSNVIQLWKDGANLVARYIDLTSRATIATGWSATSNIRGDYGGANLFDAVGLTDRFAVVYTNNGGGATLLTVGTFNATLGTVDTQVVNTGAVALGGVGIGGIQSDKLWIAWLDTTNAVVKAQGRNPTLLSSVDYATGNMIVTAVGWMAIGLVRTAALEFTIVASCVSGSNYEFHWRKCIGSAGNTITNGADSVRYFMQLATRPWTQNGRTYCSATRWPMPTSATTSTNEHYVVDVTDENSDMRAVCTIAPRLSFPAWGSGAQNATMHACPYGTAKWIFGNVVKRNSSALVAVEKITVDYGRNAARWRTVEIADALYIGGGVSSDFDGTRVTESPFLPVPDAPALSDGGGAGALSAGDYRCIALFEDTEASGTLVWSSPSVPSSKQTLAASHKLTIVAACNHLTRRPNARIVIYRTIANGSTYYRCQSLQNTKSAATVTVTDNTSDTQLQLAAQLYSQPGTPGATQPHASPPSLAFLITHQDRIVGVGDDGVTLWVSNRHVIGESMWFADLFQYPCERGGPVTGLASSDGRIIIFKRSSIHVMSGDGPSDNGAAGDYSQPEQVATDVGCTDARSICTGPFGVLFQGGVNNGIHLLDRSMSVSYIGQAVENTLASYPIVTSAVLDDVRGIVLFTLAATEDPIAGAGASGKVVAWNYRESEWTVFDHGFAAQSAAMVPVSGGAPAYHMIRPNGSVVRDDETTYLESGSTWVTQQIETAWLKVAGLQGFQKLRKVTMLAQKMTNHDMRMELAFDYESAFTESYTWTAAQINALPREQLQMPVKRRKCMAVKVRLTDATPSSGSPGTGQGPIVLGIALEVGVKPGIARVGASAKGA